MEKMYAITAQITHTTGFYFKSIVLVGALLLGALAPKAWAQPCNSPDVVLPTALCKQGTVVELIPAVPPFIQLAATDFDNLSFDNCPGALNYSFSPDTNDIVRIFTCTELGSQPIQLWITDVAGNQSFCETFVIVQNSLAPDCGITNNCLILGPPLEVIGNVFIDTDANCLFTGTPDQLLVGWPVKAVGPLTGHVYLTTSDVNGTYHFYICPEDNVVEISLNVPFNYGNPCPTTWPVNLQPNIPTFQDIPVQLETECPLMSVDIGTPFLRRCFSNTYTVNYCNLSANPIANAYVEVAFDTFLNVTSSTVPWSVVNGHTYTFPVGNLLPGQCGAFSVVTYLDCNAQVGQSHCTEAHIFPDTLCPLLPQWSGANIEVGGYCENDSVFLSISNTGTGNMAAPLDFIVVEDVIMYMQDDFDLNSGETRTIPPIHANGATWHLEAQQEPGHPYPGDVTVTLEGCNGLNTPGLPIVFPFNSPNPFVAVDCQINVGSFDPNDKQGLPIGYGPQHLIERNTDIEYLIRFQNTGTFAADKVVILDALSPYIDPATIRPGAASHPYGFEIAGGNVLRFTFNDIMLPDSNSNEPASHGFVKFTAKQLPNLPLGTVIENSAAIYFDFNAPVLTNVAFHTIGENFIQVINDAGERPAGLGELLTYPNPSAGTVTFEIPNGALLNGVTFLLHDHLGQLVRNQQFSGNRYQFEPGTLPAGMYFYSIKDADRQLYAGKVILRD